MARFLVLYGTTEGHTREVAERSAEILRGLGYEVVLEDSTRRTEPLREGEVDAVILAGSVHGGDYQAALVHFARASREALRHQPTAFLSVSLAAAGLDPDLAREADTYVARFAEATGWRPDRVLHVGGALRFTRYNFFKRLVMRLISVEYGGPTDPAKDYAFTDWRALAEFLEAFARDCPASAGGAGKSGGAAA